jgi:hypothetical protein
LHPLVQQHAASFIAHTEASTGAELPRFINDEFDASLECSIPAPATSRLKFAGAKLQRHYPASSPTGRRRRDVQCG